MAFFGYWIAYFAHKCGAESTSLISFCTAGFPLPVQRTPSSKVQHLFHLWDRKKFKLIQLCWGMATAGINITGLDTIMKECGPMEKKKKPFLNRTLQDLLMNIHLSSRMFNWGVHSQNAPFSLVGCPQQKLSLGLPVQKHLEVSRCS